MVLIWSASQKSVRNRMKIKNQCKIVGSTSIITQHQLPRDTGKWIILGGSILENSVTLPP